MSQTAPLAGSLPQKYLVIDEEGYPLTGELRITDHEVGLEILSSLRFAENGAMETDFGGVPVLVEAFDEPLVAMNLEIIAGSSLLLSLPYGLEKLAPASSLTVDEWDRFHGMTENGIPFVLARAAQATLLNVAEEYDDDSITLSGQRIVIKPWLSSEHEPGVETEKYWSDVYQTEPEPGWELNQPAPALVKMMAQLKLPKSRVLVMGAGSGNDAAYFAQAGHWVTAVDISPEAIMRGRKKYGHLENLQWLEKDLFTLGEEHTGQYDIVFEHTCYCAIPPERRSDLVKVWRRVLADQGKLMGVFFAMERKNGPPFGGTEWDLRQHLKKGFQFLYWKRWRESIGRRNGKELFVFAEKRDLLK